MFLSLIHEYVDVLTRYAYNQYIDGYILEAKNLYENIIYSNDNIQLIIEGNQVFAKVSKRAIVLGSLMMY
jgi:hypothetical protein